LTIRIFNSSCILSSLAMHSAQVEGGHGQLLVDRVVGTTLRLLEAMGKLPRRQPMELPSIMVGLEAKVQEVVGLLAAPGRSHAVLLHGMGGIGKTTLAKAVFNQLQASNPTVPCCFLGLDPAPTGKGIVEARRQILKSLGCSAKGLLRDHVGGRQALAAELRGKKMLLVVDNVWDDKLELLLPEGIMGMLGEGSAVIVTSRDLGAARRLGGPQWVTAVEVAILPEALSLQLLCRHAYGADRPPDSEQEHVTRVVGRCGGLPMAVEVVGRHLSECSDRQKFFRSLEPALPSAFKKDKAGRQDGERTLFAALRLSWNALDGEEREALLDITWFLKGQPWEVVEPYCGYGVLDRLCRFGLVKKQPLTHSRGEVVVVVHDIIVAFTKHAGDREAKCNPRRLAASGGRDDGKLLQVRCCAHCSAHFWRQCEPQVSQCAALVPVGVDCVFVACVQVADPTLLGLSADGGVVDAADLAGLQKLRLLRVARSESSAQQGRVELALPLLRLLQVMRASVLGRSAKLHVRPHQRVLLSTWRPFRLSGLHISTSGKLHRGSVFILRHQGWEAH
jgi:hypothetical protein